MATFLTTTDSSAAIERVIRDAEELSNMDKVRKQYPRAYLRWTTEEDALFLEMVDKGMARLAISDVLQRQPSAIASRHAKLRE